MLISVFFHAILALQLTVIGFLLFSKPFRSIVYQVPIVALVKWPIFTVISCIFVLLSFILSPFLSAWSVIANIKTLPGFWQWFSVLDDTLDGGQSQHPDQYPSNVTGFKLWWQRTCWICRNPANGWQSILLGFKTEGSTVLWQTTSGENNKSGFLYANVIQDANGKKWFSYRKNIPVSSWYLKTWFGWNYMAYDKVHHSLEFQPFLVRKSK